MRTVLPGPARRSPARLGTRNVANLDGPCDRLNGFLEGGFHAHVFIELGARGLVAGLHLDFAWWFEGVRSHGSSYGVAPSFLLIFTDPARPSYVIVKLRRNILPRRARCG